MGLAYLFHVKLQAGAWTSCVWLSNTVQVSYCAWQIGPTLSSCTPVVPRLLNFARARVVLAFRGQAMTNPKPLMASCRVAARPSMPGTLRYILPCVLPVVCHVGCRTLDAALVCTGAPTPFPVLRGAPDMSQGVAFNLANNIWGTNYVMWQPYSMEGRNARFRFVLQVDLVAHNNTVAVFCIFWGRVSRILTCVCPAGMTVHCRTKHFTLLARDRTISRVVVLARMHPNLFPWGGGVALRPKQRHPCNGVRQVKVPVVLLLKSQMSYC
jgi:hypothetical protein